MYWIIKADYLALLIICINIATCQKSQTEEQIEENAKEDAFLQPLELLTKYGYPGEIHHVVTEDGYILGVYRIPHGKKNSTQPSREVILLNHGLLCSSTDWIITGPSNGLGYILADAGYDVWMSNDRGNTYSRNHTYLSVESQEFWNFDWHEMGIYDLPAVIDYILGVTNRTKLSYIGHSQGTTSFYVLTSLLPEYNEKIQVQISLAPIAYLYHLRNLLLIFGASLDQPLLTFFRLFNIKDYLPVTKWRTELTNAVCGKLDILTQPFCELYMTFGQYTTNLNSSTLVAILGHYPAGSSWKQIQHYAQEINSGYFRQYDYGWLYNSKIYNRLTPPNYDVKKVTAPIILIGGKDDLLAAGKDIDRLQKELPNVLERITVTDKHFNHFDFLWGIDAKNVLYTRILKLLAKYVSSK